MHDKRQLESIKPTVGLWRGRVGGVILCDASAFTRLTRPWHSLGEMPRYRDQEFRPHDPNTP